MISNKWLGLMGHYMTDMGMVAPYIFSINFGSQVPAALIRVRSGWPKTLPSYGIARAC